MSQRILTKIDEITAKEHRFLTEDDICVFWGEYTARMGFKHSTTNNLIYNFKKNPIKKDQPEYRHKQEAIRHIANIFYSAIKSEFLEASTLIPIPPSKTKNHQEYDDRMIQVLQIISSRSNKNLDIRELIVQKVSTDPAHLSISRPQPEQIEENYEINENLIEPIPNRIILFDDLLTTGAHFVAAKSLIRKRFPSINIIGIFVARCVHNENQNYGEMT